jgi:hypothetical protein
MALPLKEHQAITDIANLMYDFLPGSGHSAWRGHVSFRTIAEKVGVENFWQPGSKTPMITALLQRTLEFAGIDSSSSFLRSFVGALRTDRSNKIRFARTRSGPSTVIYWN